MPQSTAPHRKTAESARSVLAANLVRLRQERGWSQEALAFECGLHRTFVGHVELQRRNISLDNLTLPLLYGALSPTITRPFYAVPRTSVVRTAWG